MSQVGKFFHLEEFTVSAQASRLGRELVLPPEFAPNVARLVNSCLDPLREHLGRPIVVLSGYRPEWLNTLVGGSTGSAHMEARAADFIVPGLTLMEVAKAVLELSLPFDQLILEFPPTGWVHVGVAKVGEMPRRQVLTALRGPDKTTRYTGLLQEAA